VTEVLLLNPSALGAEIFENSITHMEEGMKSVRVLSIKVEKNCRKYFIGVSLSGTFLRRVSTVFVFNIGMKKPIALL
jgi:hypothetical protein